MRANNAVSTLYYKLHIDDLLVAFGADGFDRNANAAIQKFVSTEQQKNLEFVKALKKDIKRCYHQIKSSPEEYFLMGLRQLDKHQREKFLTDKYLFMTMGTLVPREKHDLEIEDKMHFYTMAKKYFKRQAVEVSSSDDYEKFEAMVLSVKDVLFKPNDACMGHGIEACYIKSVEDAKSKFEYLLGKGGRWIVEERVHQSKEMAMWNESSCNTVRYLSFLNKNGFFVITPFFRTGRKGSVVDNAGSGGVFANVDPQTGCLCTDGVDELGRTYDKHPDSGLVFKGWQIPRYDELVSTVQTMHKEIMPTHPYIGWDMALTDEGWVVIECNWGQFVNQFADHIGRKKEFLKYVKM